MYCWLTDKKCRRKILWFLLNQIFDHHKNRQIGRFFLSLRGGGTTTKQPQSTKASFEVWDCRAPLRSARNDKSAEFIFNTFYKIS